MISVVRNRGIQYVHCMMHKCIMVKVGAEINVKYVKTRKVYEIRGKILQK